MASFDVSPSMLTEVRISGSLKKKSGSFFAGWRDRHVVLSHQMLVIYRTEKVCASECCVHSWIRSVFSLLNFLAFCFVL